MTELPKTPTRAPRGDKKAPKIQTPGAIAASPKTGRSKSQARLNDSKVTDENQPPRTIYPKGGSCKKESKNGLSSRTRTPNKNVALERSGLRLKIQNSRDAAEILAILETSVSMKVLEVSADTVVDEKAFRALVQQRVPIVFRGYAADWTCVKNWSKEGYLKRSAEEEEKTLPHRKYRRFIAQLKEKGRLHLTDGKSKSKAVTMNEFLTSTEADTSDNGLYMLGIHAVAGNSNVSYCPVQTHEDDLDSSPPLARDVPRTVELVEWYAKVLAEEQGQETQVRYDHQQFFLAKGYAFTDLHYDSYDNFYVAVTGRRRWTLACPHASRWLISATGGKLRSGSPLIPHLNDYPTGSPAQIYPFSYVDLGPGDVLFVPDCWWHLVESVPGESGFSCAFNYFFSKPPDRVFDNFQATLASTDAIVNGMQSVCRLNLAATKSSKDAEAIPSSINNAPGQVDQGIWDQLLQLAVTHNVTEKATRLHAQHMRNSVERWKACESKPTTKAEVPTYSNDEKGIKAPQR
jgi:hypothetical protein